MSARGTTASRDGGRPPAPAGRLPLVPAAAFVVVWSSGYVAAPLGVEAIEPLTLVAWRFAIAAVVTGVLARWLRGPLRISRGTLLRAGATGLMMNGAVFSAIYLAFEAGMGATLGSLLHSLSPVLTAVLAGLLLRERLTRLQVLGFVVGVLGVVVVLGPEVDEAGGWYGVAFGALSVLGLSLGTLGQRWLGEGPGGSPDPWWSATIQFAACVPFVLALSLAIEGVDVVHRPVQGALALLYLAGVNSLVGLLLLGLLVRARGAGASASLFFLMPPITALLAWVAFGEVLGPREAVGLVLTVVGVAIATRTPRTTRAPADSTPDPEGGLAP